MTIKGNSGCRFKVVSNERIIKYSSNIDYSKRLRKQSIKQIGFNQINNIPEVRAPVIYKRGYKNKLYFFEMEYCNLSDFITHLESCDINAIDLVVKKLVDLLEQYETICHKEKISSDLINKKYNSSLNMLVNLEHRSFLTDIYSSLIPKEIILPVGLCHGDMTFSNILFDNNELILIDFLDSFLESPIQDMVKLRQDTKFLWSMQLAKGDHDEVKLKIIMKYLDHKLSGYFQTKDYYKKYYRYFQLINLVRVLPYCKDSKLYNYLINSIKTEYTI